MDNLQKINSIPYLDLFAKLWILTEKSSTVNEYKIQVPWDNRISNWSYKVNIQKNIVFANWSTRPQWFVFTFTKDHLWLNHDREVFKWFEDNFNIKSEEKKFDKNIKKEDLLKNFSKYKIKDNFSEQILWAIKTWLINRWFSYEYVNSENWIKRIKEVFSICWFCENPATKQNNKKEWLPSKPVLIFPQILSAKLSWLKLRKINNLPEDENSKDTKSINITWSKSWLIYKSLDYILSCETVIIVEWEPDWVVMRMLWFDNVIWNLWWVWSCKEEIRDITKNIKTVIIAYDNDWPWKKWAEKLMEFCKRQMFYIKYTDRKNINWEKYKDINEFFEWWFKKEDFDEMIKNSLELKLDLDWRWDYNDKNSKVLQAMWNLNPFIYLRKNYEYFDIYENKIVKKDAVYDWMWIDHKELKELLNSWEIKKYYDICYWQWWKVDCYNILDEKLILKPSNNPIIHDDIRFLLENLCWNKKENFDWLNRAILYKFTHINDTLVPAVLFKWVWWSWKWTFIKLLTKIFDQENVMCWLWTQSLTSDFCPYTWHKIIVEVNELWWWNHKDAIRILDRLKSLIFEPRIMVNMKWIQPREVDNIAWFILSSNHQKPLQLDSWTSGNRRFTIINTWNWIPLEIWRKINDTINNIENVRDYLSWLFKTYNDVLYSNCINALENEDKELLTDQSESFVDKFFTWFNDNFPDINKITIRERNTLLWIFRNEVWEEDMIFDRKYSIEYFNNNLPHTVKNKKISIRWKTQHWYLVEKQINVGSNWYFQDEKYDKNSIEFTVPKTNILNNVPF